MSLSFSSAIPQSNERTSMKHKTEFALTYGCRKPEASCYNWKGSFQNVFGPDLGNFSTQESHFSMCFKHVVIGHGSKSISVHMIQCDPESSPLLVKIFLDNAFTVLHFSILTYTIICYQQPKKMEKNCSLFNHCLEKTISWSWYKWEAMRICFNSFQSLW